MTILTQDRAFEFTVPVVIVGGGGCGLCAGLAARGAGVDVLVVERDSSPLGTTAMSTGLIPAAGSKQQKTAGIEDSPELLAQDIVTKAKGQTDEAIALALAHASAGTVDWLTDEQDVPLTLVEGFLYPGHSVLRMHGSPHRTGSELMGALANACERVDVDIMTDALVTDLFADRDGRITGVRVERPGGDIEDIGCEALILACCGFAGNREMLAKYIPEILDAVFFGHPGNKGDAIRWGRELGAGLSDLTSYQGHGGLAYGLGIPILWPLIMEGGFQVNAEAKRFADESQGYSEHAVHVIAQPGNFAWSIYDECLHELMTQFDDYRDAIKAQALKTADTVAELAVQTGLDETALQDSMDDIEAMARGERQDPFGRDFTHKPALKPPYYGVKVSGALFHTQGGLVVDDCARVLREDGTPFPNLFAGGGAARGISGPGSWGYMAGNGLLTATTFGRLAGETAAALVQSNRGM